MSQSGFHGSCQPMVLFHVVQVSELTTKNRVVESLLMGRMTNISNSKMQACNTIN